MGYHHTSVSLFENFNLYCVSSISADADSSSSSSKKRASAIPVRDTNQPVLTITLQAVCQQAVKRICRAVRKGRFPQLLSPPLLCHNRPVELVVLVLSGR